MNPPARFLDGRLPPELEDRLAGELEPGERVLWVGQPDSRRSSWPSWILVVFGLASLGFSISWYMHLGPFLGFGNGPWPVQIFAAVFYLAGLFPTLTGLAMLTAPYWFARKARRSGYALTDRRAILFEASLWRSIAVSTYGPDRLRQAVRRENPDGSGDLILEVCEGVDNDGDATRTERGFLTIPEVRAVETLIRRTFADDAATQNR